MASAVIDVDVAVIPVSGETVGERVTYRAEPAFVPLVPGVVGSVHTAAAGTGVTYISGCGCCPLECLLYPCAQCVNGYGPREFMFHWENAVGFPALGYPPVIIWSNGVYASPAFNLSYPLTATGECTWEGVVIPTGPGGIFGTPANLYVKLYYTGGWKVFFDYFFGAAVLAGYVASGNGVTFTLDAAVDCSKLQQTIAITQSDGPPAPLFLQDQWRGFSGGELQPALPAFVTLYSCGNSTVLVECCAERIPRRLSLSFTGCAAVNGVTGIVLDYAGSNLWISKDPVPASILANYRFTLSCERYPTGADPFTWVLCIYDLSTGTSLEYTAAASVTTCYPILLSFASGVFHFTNGTGGDYCNGDAFDMVLTV